MALIVLVYLRIDALIAYEKFKVIEAVRDGDCALQCFSAVHHSMLERNSTGSMMQRAMREEGQLRTPTYKELRSLVRRPSAPC